MLQVILGVIHFWFSKNLVPRKRQVLQWKIHLDLYLIQFHVVIVFHICHAEHQAPGLLMGSFGDLAIFLKILWFSQCCFFYTYDFFSTKLFYNSSLWQSTQSGFLEFWNLKFKKKNEKVLKFKHCGKWKQKRTDVL